jgi:hypothetical protein
MKIRDDAMDDDIPPEIDFTGGVRGKHAVMYAEGTNIVRLEPDVALLFPNSEAVNAALRLLADLARKQAHAA